jgi:hypothetical protein
MLISDIITGMIIRSAASGDMANIQRVCAEALGLEPDADELPSILQAAQQRFCLADMRATGLRTAGIGWVGPVRFYAAAVGARVERVYWRYRKELRGCEPTMT